MSWEIVGRLAVAAVLGALIGFEREVDNHPAGVRTFTTVALGAALFGVISTVGFNEFATARANSNFQVDVTRVASQVVVGIGFIGAGLIFRRGEAIVNLTTAAGLWATAAVGLAAGIGNPGFAVVTTVILGIVLIVMPVPVRMVLRRSGLQERTLAITPASGVTVTEVRALVDQIDAVSVVWWRTEKHDGRPAVACMVSARGEVEIDEEIAAIATSGLIHDLRFDGLFQDHRISPRPDGDEPGDGE